MNILGDFINRVNALYPSDIDNEQLNSLLTTIKNEDDEIAMKDKEIARLKAKLQKTEATAEKLRAKYEGKVPGQKPAKGRSSKTDVKEKAAKTSKTPA